jgi:hypothetical protein
MPRTPVRTILWMDSEQLPLMREVIARTPLALMGVGSSQHAHTVKLASDLQTEPISDLRSTISGTGVDLVLLASPRDFGTSVEHRELITEASARGVRFITLEPIPSSALQLASDGWYEREAVGLGTHIADRVRCVPLIRESGAIARAADTIASFGPIRAMLIETWSDSTSGSLGSRLYSALELVTTLMSEPESVDAAYIPRDMTGPLRALPGESLRDLHGEITANLRDSFGRSALIFASDRIQSWRHAVTLTGDAGRLRVDATTLEWIAPDGRVVESTEQGNTLGGPIVAAAEDIARSIERAVDPGLRSSPRDHAAILSAAAAVLLSARTNQNESPATIRRMADLI